ncbi:hypothetical protein [Hymenobacter sediminicola]|uniref:Cytochrome c domain-containing protein n=1 Tax=Hymenobacter sediminicola TaxID=2761579 RepID=A0A7G7W9H7_9BACT|nr:hypothetical protein [Hymenobacter sediminicola]QNH63020.1 hypothetical protein H4317_04205 [Hymenobacter sediminicola]
MTLLPRTALPGLVTLAFSLLLTACAYDNNEDLLGNTPPAPTCDSTANTYAATVAPLLQQRCSSCHNDGFRSGNISLQNHAQTQAVAFSGRLVGAVSHAAGFQPMPQGEPKLSDCEIDHIRRWVDAGALNN